MAEDARGNADGDIAPGRSRWPRQTRGTTRVLVVDDDPQTLHSVRDALLPAGYVPLLTGDPRELQDLLRTHRPHLVLLDLRLPGADGYPWLGYRGTDRITVWGVGGYGGGGLTPQGGPGLESGLSMKMAAGGHARRAGGRRRERLPRQPSPLRAAAAVSTGRVSSVDLTRERA